MRSILPTAGFLLLSVATAGGQTVTPSPGAMHSPVAGRAPGDEALVANALSAAPPSLARTATVMGHDGRVLRRGTADWVCMPDMPDAPNDTPMCLDPAWRDFIDAWMHKRTPHVARMAFGYMLQGDLPVSNVDPFAQKPTPDNQWIQSGDPHIMVLVPDPRLLDGIGTDPGAGGPFVMWKGTPYAHVMLPTTRAPKP